MTVVVDPASIEIAPPEGATCGGCATYAHGWMGHDWKCRRGDRYVNTDDGACPKWHPRPPEAEPDVEAMRAATSALNAIFDGIQVPIIEPTPVTRERPPGLRGHSGGVVYFIDCGSMTKIGHTSGWIEDRMKGIATHNPFDITLWGLVVGDVRFERQWHAELAQFRYRNEWFRLTPEIREAIKKAIKDQGGELYE